MKCTTRDHRDHKYRTTLGKIISEVAKKADTLLSPRFNIEPYGTDEAATQQRMLTLTSEDVAKRGHYREHEWAHSFACEKPYKLDFSQGILQKKLLLIIFICQRVSVVSSPTIAREDESNGVASSLLFSFTDRVRQINRLGMTRPWPATENATRLTQCSVNKFWNWIVAWSPRAVVSPSMRSFHLGSHDAKVLPHVQPSTLLRLQSALVTPCWPRQTGESKVFIRRCCSVGRKWTTHTYPLRPCRLL